MIIANLKQINLSTPLITQEQVIPLILKKQNLLVTSPTGSGKTHAFLVPIINEINAKINKTQALIFAPTRELAQQIYQFAKPLLANTNIKVSCFAAGKVIRENSNNSHIIIGTIAKIKAIYEDNLFNLTTAKMVVIDECDMIFAAGFLEDLDYLLQKLAKNVQIIAFSATLKQELQIFLNKYITAIKVLNLHAIVAKPKINHIFLRTKINDKMLYLVALLKIINPYLAVIFVNKKNDIATVKQILSDNKVNFIILHGDIAARTRRQILKKVQNLTVQYLVTTDLFARGINISAISDIISLSLPADLQYYWHRAGRTARDNNEGNSYVFYHEQQDANKIKLLQKQGLMIKFGQIKNNKIIVDDNKVKKTAFHTEIKPFKINKHFKKDKIKRNHRNNFKNRSK